VIAQDGTFCPSTSFPGMPLTDAQRDGLFALIRDASRPGAQIIRLGCVFNPHHAFVFFDRAGTPIAELDVCFECGEWVVTPGPDKLRSPLVTPAADASFHALCRELGLGDCWSEDELANAHFDSLAERGLIAEHHGGVEDLGIDLSLSEAKTTTLQKRLLCRWAHSQTARWRRGWPLTSAFDSDDSAWGVRCTDDSAWGVVFRSADECVAKFPKCDVSVGEVERCLSARFPRAKRKYEFQCSKALPDVCTMPRECLWGLEEKPVPAP
jgi:hypothetical protein